MLLSAINTTLRLLQLRSLMQNTTATGIEMALDAYIVPLWDPHFNERVSPCHERLKFISGFSGTDGTAIITMAAAFLWTVIFNGRYYTQAGEQLDDNWTLMKDGLPETPSQGDHLNVILKNGSIGVDPFVISMWEWSQLETRLKSAGNGLVPVKPNLVDMIWKARPDCTRHEQLFSLNLTFTGRESRDKFVEARATMKKEGAMGIIVNQLDEIAWALNLRGKDLPNSAVFLSYLIILEDKVYLFVYPEKVPPSISSALKADGAELYDYDEISTKLKSIVESSQDKIWLSTHCSYALASIVPETRRFVKPTPLVGMKAVKNDVEAEGFRQALLRDGVGIVRCLHWIEHQLIDLKVENLTEVAIANQLIKFKSQNAYYLSPSFETIAAFGTHAAVIHYRPTSQTDRIVDTSALLMLDSGSIYLDGTTDITRTVHFGIPTDSQRDAYTRVLKGQIAIATSKFPALSKATRLDSFARRALWNVGLDYNHGTGHGIGLNVHEGPSFIRGYYMPEDTGYQANMFTSNEPGYYEEGDDGFGIRLENVIRVVNVTLKHNFNGRGFLGFEDMTFLPYQHKLIKTELLTHEEVDYLNAYQNKTMQYLGQFIRKLNPTDPLLEWLEREMPPLNQPK